MSLLRVQLKKYLFYFFAKKRHLILMFPLIIFSIVVYYVIWFLWTKEANQEISDFIHSVKNKPYQAIESIPFVQKYKVYHYSAHTMRNPFQAFQLSTALQLPPALLSQGPDISHPKEALEAFPLDVLKMVGMLERDEKRFALVKDTQGLIHRVTVGSFLGHHFGTVINVTEESIEIVEWINEIGNKYKNRCYVMYLNPANINSNKNLNSMKDAENNDKMYYYDS